MASPVTLYIAPHTGIEITIDRDSVSSTRSSMFPGDVIKGCTYQLSNMNQFCIKKNQAQDFDITRGFMSPIAPVTLPPFVREVCGILESATKFAYLHPPKGLASQIDWNSYSSSHRGDVFVDNDTCVFPSQGKENDKVDDGTEVICMEGESQYAWAIPYISVIGAYVYFDNDLNVVSVNVITFQKTKYALDLSGAYKTPESVVKSITETKRAQVVPLDAFHECSFVAISWIRPYETFGGNLPSGTLHDNRHGSFVFLRYDNTAVTYAVSSSYVVDYTGESEIIPDILLSQACKAINFSDMKFATNFVDDAMATRWRKYITYKCLDTKTGRRRLSSEVPPELALERSLIHEACRSGVSLDCIKELLKDKVEIDSLNQQDHFDWNPLHYACAFCSNDVELLKYLLELKPSALHQKDSYGRYPIHVLCDSGSITLDAVRLLLAGEGKQHVLDRTKYLGVSLKLYLFYCNFIAFRQALNRIRHQRLPLHIALNRGAPVDVIKALIDADEGSRSVRAETHDGMRPIHAALGPKPSADIIRLLTSADSKISDYEHGVADILSEYKGLLPIHMACLNKSTQNIVSILLDKDVEGITLFEKASDRRSKSYNDSLNDATSFSSKASTRQKPALHYAILHSTDDVILLLLNRLELESEASASILDTNSDGQSALHLACMKNTSPYIIKMLLKIDCDKKSVAAFDKDGLRPIHYACDHEDAQRKSIEYLLKAEKEFREMNNTVPSSEKSPFWYACKAQAPPDVLELLVSQPGFNLRDFDRVSLRHDLADSIKVNPNLQRQINLKMARRFNFSKLTTQIILNFVVLFTFYLATDDCSQGCTRQSLSLILWCCVVYFLLNELFQMIDQTLRGYFLDLWNWYELTMISLLSFSIWAMESNKASCMCQMIEPYQRNIIMVTGILLVMNIIFSLRSLFLPFALFATGLVNIAMTLIPFFIVSLLVLAAFAQAYRVDVNFQSPPTDGWGEDSMHGQCLDSFGSCFLAVLQGFFGGPDGTSGRTDIMFGIIVAIVLLNVVIAIVSDSWEDSKAKASTAFWRSRVNWLAESGWMQVKESTLTKKKIGIFEWIDRLKWIPLNDNISWSKDEPYTLVTSRKQYEDPWYFFDHDVAQLISDAHALESSLYWIKKDSESDKNKMGVFKLYTHLAIAMLRWFMNNFLYLILIIIGTPTFGLLWPIEFRMLLVSVGMDYRISAEGA